MKLNFNIVSNLVIIIITISLCFSLFKEVKVYKSSMIEGVVDKLEYVIGDTIMLSFGCNKRVSSSCFHFFNLNGRSVDSLILNTDTLLTQSDSSWRYGFKFGSKHKLETKKLRPGLYLFDNKLPILIKDTSSNKDILIIYPAYNNMAQSASGGRSFYKYNSKDRCSSDTISYIRPYHLDEFSKNIINLIDSAFRDNYTISNESELDNTKELLKYKLIILYGELPFVTKESLVGLENFISKGGNLIVLSPNFALSYMKILPNLNQLIRYGDTIGNPASEISTRANEVVGATCLNNSNYNSYFSEIDYFKIIKPEHALFKGVKFNNYCINYKFRLLSAPLLNLNFSLPHSSKYYKAEIIAIGSNYLNGAFRLGAIFEFQNSKTSGKVLNFGTYEFINSTLIQHPEVRKLICNGINGYWE